MKTYLILAELELNINDEYTRHVSDVLLGIVSAASPEEARNQCPHQIGDDFTSESRIEYITVKEAIAAN